MNGQLELKTVSKFPCEFLTTLDAEDLSAEITRYHSERFYKRQTGDSEVEFSKNRKQSPQKKSSLHRL